MRKQLYFQWTSRLQYCFLLMYIYFSYYSTSNVSFFIFIRMFMLLMPLCFIETTLHDLNQIKYRYGTNMTGRYIHKRTYCYVCVLIFFGNILKNLVVVYVATLAELFLVKWWGNGTFGTAHHFFVRCIYLDHADTMLT